MALTIETFPAGPVDTNAYLVIDDVAGQALIIDAPSGVTADVVDAAWAKGTAIQTIVITHAHWDHIADAAEMKAKTGVPLLAHPLDVPELAHPGSAGSQLPFTIPPVTPDRLLNDGDVVTLGDHSFVVMHLPGHDPGHIALYSEADRVFLGGDVLFPGGHGRVDIPGADQETTDRSMARLATLPGDVVVYPGHGATTTIGAEVWLKDLLKRYPQK